MLENLRSPNTVRVNDRRSAVIEVTLIIAQINGKSNISAIAFPSVQYAAPYI